jgi:hypothetical protein
MFNPNLFPKGRERHLASYGGHSIRSYVEYGVPLRQDDPQVSIQLGNAISNNFQSWATYLNFFEITHHLCLGITKSKPFRLGLFVWTRWIEKRHCNRLKA